MTKEEAHKALRQVPLISNYRIDIGKGRISWKDHVSKLDSALECLQMDEPYSLAHMPPPPMSKGAEGEWHACNPHHPWTRSVASNERELQWVRGTLHSFPTTEDPFRESRRAALEVLEWAHVAPESLEGDRRARIGPLLLHWDSGVTYDLLLAVYKVDAHEHVDYIRQLHGYLDRYGVENSWSYDVARAILNEWGIPLNQENS